MKHKQLFLFFYLFCTLAFANPYKIFLAHQKNIKANSSEYLLNNLDNCQKVINFVDKKTGLTLFHEALAQKIPNVEIIKILLQNGSNVNYQLKKTLHRYHLKQGNFYKGWTAVHIAISLNSSLEILNLIYENNGKFFQKDRDGFMPAELAFRYARTEIVEWMHKKHFDFTKLNKDNCIKKSDDNSVMLYNKYVEKIDTIQ